MRYVTILILIAGCNESAMTAGDGGTDGGACANNGARPPARKDADAVLLAGGKTAVVFGGDQAPFDPTAMAQKNQLIDDLWLFDLSCGTWQLSALHSTPGPRAGYAATLDTKRNRVIILGGRAGAATSAPLSADVWALDATALTWTQLMPAGTGPGARIGHQIVYDSQGDRLLFFGGDSSSTFGNGIKGDTWELGFAAGADGTWNKLIASGMAGAPSPRRDVAMAVDGSGKTMVIFGGAFDFQTYTDEVWAFDLTANQWRQLTTGGLTPTPRFAAKMVLDDARSRFVLFGGHDALALGLQNDTYALSLNATATTATLTQLVAGDMSLGVGGPDRSSPERRDKHGLVLAGDTLWTVAGVSDCGELDDTWKLNLATTPLAWTAVFPAHQGETCARRAQPGQTCPSDCGNPL